MRHLAITSLVAGGLAFAAPAFAQDDPMQDPSQQEQPSADPSADDTFGEESQPSDQTAPVDAGPADERDQSAQDMEATAGSDEYVVKEGDTLSSIAEEQLGDANRWEQIAQENEIDDPTKLTVGKRLSLPQSEAVEEESGELEQ